MPKSKNVAVQNMNLATIILLISVIAGGSQLTVKPTEETKEEI